jgi:hypothetical protein
MSAGNEPKSRKIVSRISPEGIPDPVKFPLDPRSEPVVRFLAVMVRRHRRRAEEQDIQKERDQ